MIEQEDRQDIDTPILAKQEQKSYDYHEQLNTYYSTQYMLDLMKNQALLRNICFTGHLSHGKTLFLDMLIQSTHNRNWNPEKNYRWLDTRVDEQ